MDFFRLSKALAVFTDPLNLLAFVLLAALVLLWRGRWTGARRLLAFVVAGLFAVTVFPIGDLLLFVLEQRFPAPASLPDKVDGIIMLGGAQQARLTAAYGQRALNGAAERMTTFLALARRYPRARFVFAGGSRDVLHPETREQPTVRMFLEQQGFDAKRVQYESGSRTTYENVVNAKALIRPRPEETWLLVQSAAEIPRSIGVFNKQGWTVTPVPCDYNAAPPEWLPGLSATAAFEKLDHALHEWIGLVVYYITGKTDRLFPAPAAAR
ncbi:MAG: YdcF family protein [Gammaproteobacteria bacterium]